MHVGRCQTQVFFKKTLQRILIVFEINDVCGMEVCAYKFRKCRVRYSYGITFKVNIRINLLGKNSSSFSRIFHMLHSESLRQSFSIQWLYLTMEPFPPCLMFLWIDISREKKVFNRFSGSIAYFKDV